MELRGNFSNNFLNPEDIQIFQRLGLSFRQAKVVIAISKLGLSSTKEISHLSEVARPDIYRVIRQLQKLGLVQKVIDKPTKFQAIPIQSVIDILVNRKNKELNELKKESSNFLEKFMEYETEIHVQKDTAQFVLIPKNEAKMRMLKNSIKKAQSNIDIISSRQLLHRLLSTMLEVFKTALRRGVEIRWILDCAHAYTNRPFVIVQHFGKNPLFKLRFIPKCPGERLGIFDKKEACITIDPIESHIEVSALWTNNPIILSIVNDFYELLWITSMETPQNSTNHE